MENSQDFLEGDIIEGKRVRSKHRNEVKLQYDSDSSLSDYQANENEDDKNEKDDDLFASEEEEDKQPQAADDQVELDELDDKEDFNDDNKQSGVYEAPSSSEDDGDEDAVKYYTNAETEAQSGQPKPNPKFEKFNLDDEHADGVIDSEGNIHTAPSNDDIEEAWMDVKAAETRKTKRAQEQRDKRIREHRKQQLLEIASLPETIILLVQHLESAETPMEALARLGPKKNTKRSISEQEEARKRAVHDITESCDRMTNFYDIDEVYDQTKEEFLRLYSRETGVYLETRGLKRSHEDELEWEFCWKGEDVVNGPYSTEQMAEWAEHHFNGDVVVRKVGDGELIDVDKVRFAH